MAITTISIERSEGCRNVKFTTAKRNFEVEFREITQEELMKHRISGKPGVVMKDDDKIFYAEYQRGMSIYLRCMTSKHVCGQSGRECKRFSTASDCNGGCAKVRDLFITAYAQNTRNFAKAHSQSKRIEKYEFVREGFEIFNSPHYMLLVTKCSNYVKIAPRNITTVELNAAQKLWHEDDERRKKEAYERRYEEA